MVNPIEVNKDVAAKLPKATALLNSLSKPANGYFQFFDENTSLDSFDELRENADKLGVTLTDWSEKAPESWQNLLVARVNESEEVRFVGVADIDLVMADPTARELLYEAYVKMVSKALRNPGAQEVQFTSIANGLRAPDEDAFRFQRLLWVKILQKMGLDRIDKESLEMALSSHSYAESQFPGTKREFWDKISHMMAVNAVEKGKSDAIFTNWRATRDLAKVVETEDQIDFAAGDTLATLMDRLAPKTREKFVQSGAVAANADEIKADDADVVENTKAEQAAE